MTATIERGMPRGGAMGCPSRTGRALRRGVPGLAAVLVAAGLAVPAVADESPLRFLRALMQEPAHAIMQSFKPPKARTRNPRTLPGPGAESLAPDDDASPPPTSGEAPAVADVPMPRLRPVRPGEPAAAAIASVTGTAAPPAEGHPSEALGYVPAPRIRPPVAGPPVRATAFAPPAVLAPIAPGRPPALSADCPAALAALGVVASPLAPISEGACHVATPIAVSALAGGAVDFSTKAIIDCPVAETLAAWLRDSVNPAAARLGGKVTGLRIAASYDCRTRDHLPNEKLSEHAFGRAIDIAAFEIDGKRWIAVGGGHSDDEQAFIASVRQAACGPFSTVLGPGSDSFHTDHLHLDMAQRGKSKYALYCH